MNNKIINIISIILLLFVGFVALTQESDIVPIENDFESQEGEDDVVTPPLAQKEPARWFKSNSGGLAIKEIKSRIIALRNEYALSIESAHPDEMPVYIQEFYKDEYSMEIRTLYKNSKKNRVQWLLRDADNRTRVIAVVFESFEEKIVLVEKEVVEIEKNENAETEVEKVKIAEDESKDEEEGAENIAYEKPVKENRKEIIERKNGFIEIFDEESNLSTEYTYFKNGDITKIEFSYNKNLLINAVSYISKQDEEEKYIKIFTDFYWYNRSMSLRTIERIFHVDIQVKNNDIVKISFPRNIKDTTNNDMLINERINLYPDFFGEVYIESDSKMVYDIDNRGRILKQTLYNEAEEVVWVITNTWKNNRIILTEKIEGETKLSAEYAYNSSGDKISEKNYNNGVLERTIIAEGNIEVEELYYNNVVILRAIWEEGIKISETRIK